MSKSKVTLSLDQGLLGAVDEAVKHTLADSRSAVVEEAIRLWQLEQRRRRLEQGIEAYYQAQTPAEQREDRAWDRVAGRHAKDLWED